MRGRGVSGGGGPGRGRGSGGPIVSGARHAAPVSVLTRKNEASSSQVGAEEDADPMYGNVREPVLLAPIVTEFEFPPHIKDLLKANGVRHLLSDCVEYHDSHGLQQGRQVAPMVNWSRMVRDMRISVALFAVADVEYFHNDLVQLDNVQAVLAGSKPLWSAHLTLSGHIQRLHLFLLQSVALFVVDTPASTPPAQPPAQMQQPAPAPPAAVEPAEMENYQHHHQHPCYAPFSTTRGGLYKFNGEDQDPPNSHSHHLTSDPPFVAPYFQDSRLTGKLQAFHNIHHPRAQVTEAEWLHRRQVTEAEWLQRCSRHRALMRLLSAPPFNAFTLE